MSSTPRLLGGRYEVGELIGRGGMAEVHLGHDARLGRPVAIKILRTDHARDATFLYRFRREAQSVAGLNHRSIVAVYDSGEDRMIESGGAELDIPYIVMEHVDGRTLREVLNEEGHLAPAEAARICEAVLDALAYSHQMGIVHRDIKPGNVMIADDGSVKVMDFGIARAVADAQATMTQTQAVIGTAQYISPEQARGETVDNRSDIYSTGCLLFELLTGRTPFVGEPIALTYQHVNAAVPRPSDLAPQVPEALDAVVLHALAKDRDDRYQDAQDMAEDLGAFVRGMPVRPAAMATLAGTGAAAGDTQLLSGAVAAQPDDPPTSTQPAVPAAEPRRKRGALGWVLAALLLLGIGGLALYAWSASRPDPVQKVAVADLVGLDEDAAKAKLREAGLNWETAYEESEDATGQVTAQDPSAGTRLDPGGVVTITVSTGVGQTRVPDLAGASRAEAERQLEDAGLTVGSISRENDSERAKDEVISTQPGAGADVERGSAVNLVIATGQVQLPDVTGKAVDDVRSQLFELGLQVDETTQETDEEKPGTVLSQSPGAGKVSRGSTVKLTVAAAPARTVTETTSSSSSSASLTTPDSTTSTSDDDDADDGDVTPTPDPTSTSPGGGPTPTTPPTP